MTDNDMAQKIRAVCQFPTQNCTSFVHDLRDFIRQVNAGTAPAIEPKDPLPPENPEPIPYAASIVENVERGIRLAAKQVHDFHDKQQVSPVQRLPNVLSGLDDTLEFTAAIMGTQAQQLLQVSHDGDQRLMRAHLLTEELAELLVAMRERDEVKALDALADLLYVLLGTAVTLDLPIAEAFTAVHASNMTKERQPDDPHGERVRDKGSNYVAPDVAGLLMAYRLNQMMPHGYSEKRGECLHCGMSKEEIFKQIDKYGQAKCKGGL